METSLLGHYEEPHLRNDNTKPVDVTTAPEPACPLQMRKLVMDAVAKSCISYPGLRPQGGWFSVMHHHSPDQIMHVGEGDEFSADSRSRRSLQTATSIYEIHSSCCFEPFGPQGMAFCMRLYYRSCLLFTSCTSRTPSGCKLMQRTFAMSADQAASHIIRRYLGARLTWTTVTWTTQRAASPCYEHCPCQCPSG